MRGKLIFVAGAAAGFVLGARAGHERYEQITERTSKVWHSRAVQRQVVKAEDWAGGAVADLVDAVVRGVGALLRAVVGRRPDRRSGTDRRTGSR